MAVCSHLDAIRVTTLPEPIAGCEECLKIGQAWVHLRKCLVCGHVGCCDSSIGKHANKHYQKTGHEVIRPAEPGEVVERHRVAGVHRGHQCGEHPDQREREQTQPADGERARGTGGSGAFRDRPRPHGPGGVGVSLHLHKG